MGWNGLCLQMSRQKKFSAALPGFEYSSSPSLSDYGQFRSRKLYDLQRASFTLRYSPGQSHDSPGPGRLNFGRYFITRRAPKWGTPALRTGHTHLVGENFQVTVSYPTGSFTPGRNAGLGAFLFAKGFESQAEQDGQVVLPLALTGATVVLIQDPVD